MGDNAEWTASIGVLCDLVCFAHAGARMARRTLGQDKFRSGVEDFLIAAARRDNAPFSTFLAAARGCLLEPRTVTTDQAWVALETVVRLLIEKESAAATDEPVRFTSELFAAFAAADPRRHLTRTDMLRATAIVVDTVIHWATMVDEMEEEETPSQQVL